MNPLPNKNVNAMELISSCDAFSGLSEVDVKFLASASVVQSFARGDVLIHKGSRARGFYIIISGVLRQEMTDENGEIITIRRVFKGKDIGLQSLLGVGASGSNIAAASKASVLFIPRATFETIFPKKDTIGYTLLALASKQLFHHESLIAAFSSLDVAGRVRFFLRESSFPIADGRAIVPGRLSVQELSSMVGASRELVGRCVRDLKAAGLVKTNDRGEMVLARDLLS